MDVVPVASSSSSSANRVSVSLLRGLLEVLQLDFLPRDVSEAPESQLISFHLELPGNIKDAGVMRIYTSQRDYVGLAPLVLVRDAAVDAVRDVCPS